ncbi:hypothetical protein V7128_15255 [Neobacillus vireti]
MRKFYEDKIHDTIKLYYQTIDVLLVKALYHRPPLFAYTLELILLRPRTFLMDFLVTGGT